MAINEPYWNTIDAWIDSWATVRNYKNIKDRMADINLAGKVIFENEHIRETEWHISFFWWSQYGNEWKKWQVDEEISPFSEGLKVQ